MQLSLDWGKEDKQTKISGSRGMKVFSIVWFGQLVSTLGSGLTGFALGVWIYQLTGSVTLLAMNLLAYKLPTVLLSPLAGSLADRWDRRWVMVLSDAGAGLSTLVIALLLFTDHLSVWHVYGATAFNAGFTALQWPAYSAATSQLVPKEHLGRAGGMAQIGDAISQLASPVIAGTLIVTIGLAGVLWIDFFTFGVAVLTLLLVRFPRLPAASSERAAGGNILQDARFGWHYITVRTGLFWMMAYFALVNFFFSMISPLFQPLLLELGSPDTLGIVFSIVGLGMLVGTVMMSVWGGPRRRIRGMFGFAGLTGLFLMVAGARPSMALIATGGFGVMFCVPIVNAAGQAIWQAKVPHEFQGRVFAVRRMLALSVAPLGVLAAGPLADRVFEPLFLSGGLLFDNFGRLFGTGPGRGISLLIVLMGMFTTLTAIVTYLHPRVRLVEDELPDAETDQLTEMGIYEELT
jgi:MFS family permease